MTESLVRELYEKFPYPQKPKNFKYYASPGFALKKLNFRLQRRELNCFAANLRIWIAGAGTASAVKTALNFPQAQILATDISEKSLQISKQLAERFGVKNITHEVEALGVRNRQNEFDLVICTGVLHHLPEPSEGLRILREALKPQGAAHLMVYNTQHRAFARSMQHATALLCAQPEVLSGKEEAALRLMNEILSSEHFGYLREKMRKLHELNNVEVFADTVLHPLETSFSVDTLFSLISENGFRFVNWYNPEAWDPMNLLKDERLRQEAEKLDLFERSKLVYLLKNEASPLLEFFVEKSDAPRRLSYSDEEILKFKLQAPPDVLERSLEEPDRLIRHNWADQAAKAPLSDLYLKLLENCDGVRTIEEHIEFLEANGGQRMDLKQIKSLLNSKTSLLAPCF